MAKLPQNIGKTSIDTMFKTSCEKYSNNYNRILYEKEGTLDLAN